MLRAHFEKSPCFMKHTGPDHWLKEKTRLFAAADTSDIVAYIETADTAENFVTEVPQIQNICGGVFACRHIGERDCIPIF